MFSEILARLQSLPWLTGDPGLRGMLLYVGVIVVSQLVFLPISPFDIAAGFAFGFQRGVLLMMVAKLLSALLSFNLARSVARHPVQRLASRFPILAGLNIAIEKGGWKLATLFRFCPIPFGVANYAFGLTRLSNWHHLMSTGLAVLWPSLIFVSMGASAKNGIASIGDGSATPNPWIKIMAGAGIVAALFVIRYVSKVAIRSMKESQNESSTTADLEPRNS